MNSSTPLPFDRSPKQRVCNTLAAISLLVVGAGAIARPATAQSASDAPPNFQVAPDASFPLNSPTAPATSSPVPAPTNAPIDSTVLSQPIDAYVLGAGDQVRIDIFDVPELSGDNGTYTVLADGSLNLPWIGSVSVRGMSLSTVGQELTQRYARFIRDPLITVSLLTERPVRVAVTGQVNRPGTYTTGQSAGEGRAGEVTADTAGQLSTVTQAIQTAGGITQVANIRNIEVRRPRLNQPPEVINVDLFALLRGDLGEDMTLRDGDTVFVPTATVVTAEEATELASASFSPNTIDVNVVGEVVNPGTVQVPPNVTLNQAILAAGGFDNRRARTADVELVRLNADGTVSRREIPVDFSAGISEESNPALRSNDIVIVGRSGITRTSDFLDTITRPLAPLLGILGLFGL
ncbi:polysaccharide export protein [Microcoleus sp. FACHB-1515]|uniref:polysaccharide biosynthesis/export family protein n=1 Tax=Cyanophyceae TaxID=3028117 RepID=UPI0016831E5B|nr:polysaccharide biosynthesis/export family protein [Microcoleus sp. FACHB-1515]MBD2090412.1 polysaccharide export protein [Microcoleus sp. FACHB-1515]